MPEMASEVLILKNLICLLNECNFIVSLQDEVQTLEKWSSKSYLPMGDLDWYSKLAV